MLLPKAEEPRRPARPRSLIVHAQSIFSRIGKRYDIGFIHT